MAAEEEYDRFNGRVGNDYATETSPNGRTRDEFGLFEVRPGHPGQPGYAEPPAYAGQPARQGQSARAAHSPALPPRESRSDPKVSSWTACSSVAQW